MKSIKELLKALPLNFISEAKAEKEKFSLNFAVKRVVLAVLFLIVSTALTSIITLSFGTGVVSTVFIILMCAVLLTIYQVLDRAVDKSA